MLSLGQCHKPTGWLPCPVCFSGGRLGPEAGLSSAGPQCCRALKDIGSAGPPSSPGHQGSCRGEAPQLAGSLRICGHFLETPGKEKGYAQGRFIGTLSIFNLGKMGFDSVLLTKALPDFEEDISSI